MVMCSVIEFTLNNIYIAGLENLLELVLLLRILRLVRVSRLLRLVTQFRTLWELVNGLKGEAFFCHSTWPYGSALICICICFY